MLEKNLTLNDKILSVSTKCNTHNTKPKIWALNERNWKYWYILNPRVLERKQGEKERLPDDIGWKIVAEEMGLEISHRKLKKHMGKWQCCFRAKA